MRISDDYKRLNAELHETRPDYGTSGHKWAEDIEALARATGARTILDYGAGKGTLAKSIRNRTIICYDPCIPGMDSEPEPADCVTCTDVLEHIEPELLDNVLDHLKSLATHTIFLVVATRPAKKTLADGRNAHLIQQPAEWWLPKIMERWRLISFADQGGEFIAMGARK